IAVSLGCLAVALYLLHRLTALDFGRAVAATTVTLLALSPAAFFLSAVYSESLFLVLSVGAVLAARTDRWWTAGALGALAACTRSAGVLLVVPLALMYLYGPRGVGAWEAHGGRVALSPRFPLRPDALALALVPLGLLAYCLALALSGQDPLGPFVAQEAWLRAFAGPFVGAWDGAVAAVQGVRQLLSGAREPVLFTAAAGDPYTVAGHNLHLIAWLIAALVALGGAARRLPAAYTVYAAAALVLPLSWPVAPQPLMSLPRFLLVLWPLWLWLALWVHGRPARRRVVMALCVAGLVVSTGLFATWHWVA
ncbi:MAG TPA: mannosyltransferase family protein, partial [Solirubrobacteraceae bacterium]|nr:mannosyltransferase family protein [Solirubrobacteraceae bacterium]